ncbi:HEAT repeat domain-containing protein [Pseudomonas moraviensis]|uniref:HEAT repeat domain-containing protein n=1 Tax=Pseudomonas moraviensis TaxID=321662 RepID=UPI002B2A5B56|nr:HEAT repeat domain-containing protein [Pseudomonas moraviensis]
MTISNEENLYKKLCSWIGESEDSHWTEYSTELVAKTVLIDFNDKDWEVLKKTILKMPEFWQQRCAVSLGENRTDQAIEILKILLSESKYKDVKIISIYELDWAEIPIEKKYSYHIKEIIDTTPKSDIEPEIYSLLAKAESSET